VPPQALGGVVVYARVYGRGRWQELQGRQQWHRRALDEGPKSPAQIDVRVRDGAVGRRRQSAARHFANGLARREEVLAAPLIVWREGPQAHP
jgi:hypothetical protein